MEVKHISGSLSRGYGRGRRLMVAPVANPYREAVDAVIEMGGDPLKLCYQCGLCSGVCPWNLLTSFIVRRLIHQVQLGLVDFESPELWMCATCGACVQRCPRGVDIIDVMKALRRTVVGFGIGPVPDSIRIILKNVAGAGNPWGESDEKRADWAQELGVKAFREGTELLYYPCCLICYDASVVRMGRALAKVLQKVGVDFGILGPQENCCGESVRKVGDEDTFQNLMRANIGAWAENGVKRILVSSPHCYHTFKNEYPLAEKGIEVVHTTEFLAELLREGKLAFSKSIEKKVAYHDPCYLGRHSGIYEEPREILRAIPGLELMELPGNRDQSLCCGGGGGRIWMETKVGERFAEVRVQQAIDAGADVIAVACPYCLLCFESCVQPGMMERAPEIRSISELVMEAM